MNAAAPPRARGCPALCAPAPDAAADGGDGDGDGDAVLVLIVILLLCVSAVFVALVAIKWHQPMGKKQPGRSPAVMNIIHV